jgi:hypothetical protein
LKLIHTDGCSNPITPINAVLHSTTVLSLPITAAIAPGETVIFACKHVSEHHVYTCQENGLWYPDPSIVLCPSKFSVAIIIMARQCTTIFLIVHLLFLDNCQIPTVNNLVEVDIINSTVQLQGSELTLRCKKGLTPITPHLGEIVCSSNGTWIPDPTDYECQANFNWRGSYMC